MGEVNHHPDLMLGHQLCNSVSKLISTSLKAWKSVPPYPRVAHTSELYHNSLIVIG